MPNLREYVWLDGTPVAFFEGSNQYQIHVDHLGTPLVLTNSAGAVAWEASHHPFGTATIAGALTFNLRFPGQYYDAETGLHYNWRRYYDPNTGRYLTTDPVGLQGGINLYAYAHSNPISNADPTGEYGIAGTAYGAISGGIGGFISGGWEGAFFGSLAGAMVGFANPYSSHVVGASVGAGVSSLLGQGAGNWAKSKDVSDPCNYDFPAAAGAALGGALGGPMASRISSYIGPYRYQIISRPLNAPGLSRVHGNSAASITEGILIGAGELSGKHLYSSIADGELDK